MLMCTRSWRVTRSRCGILLRRRLSHNPLVRVCVCVCVSDEFNGNLE